MREYQQKKRFKRRIFSKISIVLLAVILFFLARATYNVYKKDNESSANLARANASLSDTEARYAALTKEDARLKTEEGIEEEIRHKFQVSKEGEKVIVVVDDQGNATTTSGSQSFFDKIKQAFSELF